MKGKVVLHSILLVILLVSFASMVKMEFAQLLVLSVLVALSLIGLITYQTRGQGIIFMTFLLCTIVLVAIWARTGTLFIILSVLAVIGFLTSIPAKAMHVREEPHSMIVEEDARLAVAKVTHDPGKFVASSNSNRYHAPKCEWAKKIKKERRTWFNSKEDAWEKGYRAHNCVE
jgi:predicted membrane protein